MGQWRRRPQARRKTPHRARPGEELYPPYDIKLVLCRILHLFLGESTKTAATRVAHYDSNVQQIVCRLRLRPRPHRGSLQRSPRPPGCISEPISKGMGRERRGEEGREFVLCPRKKKKSLHLWIQPVVKLPSKRWWIPVGMRHEGPKLEPTRGLRAFKELILVVRAFK